MIVLYFLMVVYTRCYIADPGSQPALSDHGDEFDQSPVNFDVTEATEVYGGDVVSA